MYSEIEGGTVEHIQGVDCNIPPVGYVYNVLTGKVEQRQIYTKSAKPSGQFWSREDFVITDYEKRRQREIKAQAYDNEYVDPDLEAFRRTMWDIRLNGMWFLNDGEPTYITGLHAFYLLWIYIGGITKNGGYPDYWDSDRKFFYFLDYCIKDPRSLGLLYCTKRRAGKALAIDTDIPTPDGFRKLGDLKEGDYVFNAKGDAVKILFATDTMYDHKCYKVTFDDGSSVIADEEHRWYVRDKQSRNNTAKRYGEWSVVTTAEMLDAGIKTRNGREYNFHTPMNDAVDYPKRDLPIDPYILGIWLGDGSRSGSQITSVDEEVISAVEDQYVLSSSHKITSYFSKHKESGVPMRSQLKEMGLLQNKHIPEEYMTASIYQRMELLRGLLDSDGYICRKGKIEFTSKREGLAVQVRELLSSLGIKNKLSVGKAKLYGKDCGYRYRINFKTEKDVFKLTRKRERIDTSERNYAWAKIRAVVSIEEVDSVPVRCIQVDDDDSLFLCGRDYIVTHNTAKSVAFLLDLPTRFQEANAGIQSKTYEDAKEVVFQKGVVKAFKRLPDFFIPPYDTGSTLKNEIKFTPTIRKNQSAFEHNYLGGEITFRASNETAYDGSKLHRYVADEIFKSSGVDIRDRHGVVAYCLTGSDGDFIGKMLCTSTVEEIEGAIEDYRKFWRDSDVTVRNEMTGRTTTGLYRYFDPADHLRNRDKHGKCDVEKNREYILADRASVRHDTKLYYSKIRKEPLTIEEAFKVSGHECLFDAATLNERLDFLSWQDAKYEVGNFVWADGRDSEVVWQPHSSGRWKIRRTSDFDNLANRVQKIGSNFKPMNTKAFVMGVDPFDHRHTVDSRRSNGAAYVFRKYDVNNLDESNMFVCEYIERPPTPTIFYEDMIKTAFFFGAGVLFEDNKPGIRTYFEDRGYRAFLVVMPGRKDSGLPGSKKTHQQIAEYTEDYIYHNMDKVWFPALVEDWLRLDINNTTDFDAAMAAGYTLIADNEIKQRKPIESKPVTTIFKKRKVPAL